MSSGNGVLPPSLLRAAIPIHLERRDPARNRWRFQTIAVPQTRLGAWALVGEGRETRTVGARVKS
ncbi:MAG: hypothetical protein RKO66_15295 [Candidatus Contendobacter sp.]|nr:hypothetical protein [Candidatus Contendobacter sp.]